jgi:three-Cys-motif partner protein
LKKSHTENTVGRWAKQKLDALESYLAAYHRVMQNQKFKLIYIDAFAGAGWSRVRSGNQDDAGLDLPFDDEQAAAEEEFIAGSPVRALTTGRGFDQHYFFDADPSRAELLHELTSKFPNKEIHVEVGDANDGVQKLARRFQVSPNARGVAFLDPYGPNLHWETVRALADTGKVDVIINFPLAMAINRLITKNAEISEKCVRLLDECFGTHEWYDLAYEEPNDLFGAAPIRKSEATAERLLALYHDRLKDAFGHVVSPSLVKNTRGAPLYYLMWAASHSRGAPIAEHIMRLGSRIKPPERK